MSNVESRPGVDPPAARRLAPRVAFIVLGSLVAVGAVIATIGAVLPRNWHVQASVSINAPPPAVHAVLDDLSSFPRWAQWDHSALTPHAELGPESHGPGATLRWYAADAGGHRVTGGTVTIVRSDPQRGVWFESRTDREPVAHAALTFEPGPGVTEVTWEDRGTLPPIIGGLFRDQYQQRLLHHLRRGLARLKDEVEGR